MKKKSLLTTLLLIIGLGSYTILNTSYSGGFGGNYQTSGCTGGSCHGASNTSTTVTISGLPTFYNVSTAYPFSVTVTNAAQVAAGFQVRTNIGTLSTTDGQIIIGGGGQSAGHNQRKSMVANTATFNLVWTSPATGGTAATFDAAGNAVNNNFSPSGDFWNFATSNNVALPVQYLSLVAQQIKNGIDIKFATLNEENVDHFEIQKSIDGNNFITIAEENPNSLNEYITKDYNVENGKTYYFRVVEISTDNKETYSDIVSAKYKIDQNTLAIHPTIINNYVLKIHNGKSSSSISLRLYNFLGQNVFTASNVGATVSIPFLPNGFYIANIVENNQSVLTQKIIIQK